MVAVAAARPILQELDDLVRLLLLLLLIQFLNFHHLLQRVIRQQVPNPLVLGAPLDLVVEYGPHRLLLAREVGVQLIVESEVRVIIED